MAAVNALNAGKSDSGLLPSAVSCETTCTKLTPSSSLNDAYRSPDGWPLVELREHMLDVSLVRGRLIGPHAVAHHHPFHGLPPLALMARLWSTGMTTTANGVPASSLNCGKGLPNAFPPTISFV